MGLYILNSLTLKDMGIRLLPDEKLEVAVELEGGFTEELEQRHATLLLTNKRLIRYYVSGHRTNFVTLALQDVDSVEFNRTNKNRQWVGVGGVFIAGGILLAILSLSFLTAVVSSLLMALSLTLIGVVFILVYAGGMTGEVTVRAGSKDIKCKMKPKALEDTAFFAQRLYELKLGYTSTVEDDTEAEIPYVEEMPEEPQAEELNSTSPPSVAVGED